MLIGVQGTFLIRASHSVCACAGMRACTARRRTCACGGLGGVSFFMYGRTCSITGVLSFTYDVGTRSGGRGAREIQYTQKPTRTEIDAPPAPPCCKIPVHPPHAVSRHLLAPLHHQLPRQHPHHTEPRTRPPTRGADKEQASPRGSPFPTTSRRRQSRPKSWRSWRRG